MSGLGIILFSPFFVANLHDGQDYLSENYSNADQVLAHIREGSIVGFGTSSPGDFILEIREGYPLDSVLAQADFKLRLAINVIGGKVTFADLYELLDWRRNLPAEQSVPVPDGIYHLTVFGSRPPSGRLGDRQEIFLYLNRLSEMPLLSYEGIPLFC